MTGIKNASKLSMYTTNELRAWADLLLKRASGRTDLVAKQEDLADAMAYLNAYKARVAGNLADNSEAVVIPNKSRLAKYTAPELRAWAELYIKRSEHRDSDEKASEDMYNAVVYLRAYFAKVDGSL